MIDLLRGDVPPIVFPEILVVLGPPLFVLGWAALAGRVNAWIDGCLVVASRHE